MSSLKTLASKVVNGDAGAVNVWSRPHGEIVAVGGGPGDARDRWSGSADEWKRALTEAILTDSRHRVDQKIKTRLVYLANSPAPPVEALTAEAKDAQAGVREALKGLEKETEGLAGRLF